MIFNTPIIEQKVIAEGTREVTFKRPDDFDYVAGQYIQVAVPTLKYSDPKGDSRVFSLTSNPSDSQHLSVLFRDSGTGFKETLASLPNRTEVIIEGPMGLFMYPKGFKGSQVYVAGGVGIAPFLSMITYHASENLTTPITLLYANRNPQTAAYLIDLQTLASENSWFTLHEVYGRIEVDTFQNILSQEKMNTWFLVGPPPMVTHTKSLLQSIGVSENKIYIESFTGY